MDGSLRDHSQVWSAFGRRAPMLAALVLVVGCGDDARDDSPLTGAAGTPTAGASGTPATGAGGMTAGVGATGGGGTSAAIAGSGGAAGQAPAGADGSSGAGGMPAGTAGSAGEAGMGGDGAGAGGSGGSTPEPVTCPQGPALTPGDTNGTIEIGGTTRTYILHVPTGYTGDEPVPLLVDLHPLTQNARWHRGNSGYAAVADREGFVVVYPDGIDAAWNIGPCCTRSRTVDDLGFMLALVEKIKGQACIDPKRVYAAGFSMGGGMSHFLACKAADVFAAVAPAAFDLIEEIDCQPSRPITVISFRGTADPIVRYEAHESTPPVLYPLDPIHFLGAEGTFEKWAMLNGCTGSPMDTGGGCQAHTQCQAGVEVTLCTTVGGSHTTGDPEVGWAMLEKHPMP